MLTSNKANLGRDRRFALCCIVLGLALLQICNLDRSEDSIKFVLESNCQWTKPQQCRSGSYNIDVQVAESYYFPSELKESALVAANYWSKTITGRRASPSPVIITSKVLKQFELACGMDFSNKTDIEGLLVCLTIEPLNSKTLAKASVFGHDTDDNLPRLALVSVNWNYAEQYDRCTWNNVMLHEIGHALGFSELRFGRQGLLLRGSIHGLKGRHAKGEWDKLVGSTTSTYPPLSSWNEGHWPANCFQHGEVMEAGMRTEFVGRRISVSRLTLAVYEDLGYSVDYRCSDDNVEIAAACSLPLERWKGVGKLFALFLEVVAPAFQIKH